MTPLRSVLLAPLIGSLLVVAAAAAAFEQGRVRNDEAKVIDPLTEYQNITFDIVVEDPADYPVNGFLDIREVALGQNRTLPNGTAAKDAGPALVVFRVGFRDAGFGDDDVIVVFFTINNGTQTFASGFSRLGKPTTAAPLGITIAAFDQCIMTATRAFCELSLEKIDAGPGDVVSDPDAVSYGSPASLPGVGPLSVAVDHAPCDGLFVTCGAILPPPKGRDFVLRDFRNGTTAGNDSAALKPGSPRHVPSVAGLTGLAGVAAAALFLRGRRDGRGGTCAVARNAHDGGGVKVQRRGAFLEAP